MLDSSPDGMPKVNVYVYGNRPCQRTKKARHSVLFFPLYFQQQALRIFKLSILAVWMKITTAQCLPFFVSYWIIIKQCITIKEKQNDK
jgi:hypothetical protein